MAARTEIAQRKAALLRDLRARHQDQNSPGQGTALRQRELSQQYGLSIRTISLVLQELVDEGVLYTVPRIGTFLGRPAHEVSQPYLLVSNYERIPQGFLDQFQIGFEDQIAHLGGACLTMTQDEALWQFEQGNFPPLSGVFEIGWGGKLMLSEVSQKLKAMGSPVASFGAMEDSALGIDLVDFDNDEGGAQSARHMLSMGHRQIAFLALHNEKHGQPLRWSVQREAGFLRVMRQTGQESGAQVYHPVEVIQDTHQSQIDGACEASARLLREEWATAVVAVNVFAAHGLLKALRMLAIPVERWPAIVCFDKEPASPLASPASMISFLRLPWGRIGAEAGQLLWERKTGRLMGSPQQRLVPMQLIPRLTCRPDWARASGLAQSRAMAVF